MKLLLLSILALLLSGCFYANERGISTRLYSDCKEYYDDDGNYVKKCPDDTIITYEDLHK